MFFFSVYGDHRSLHVLTHSFPTRRSSDLATPSLKRGVNATYLDAYYSRYPDGPPTFEQRANGAERQDLSGKRTDFAPEGSGLVRLEHVATLPGDLRLTTDISAILKSSY